MLYHLALADEWVAARARGTYERSTIGLSLAEVGFIHLSRAEQVQGTADAYYRDAGAVVLLRVDPELAGAEIRDDPVGETTFPHLYGPLPVAAVVEAIPLERDGDGRLVIPD